MRERERERNEENERITENGLLEIIKQVDITDKGVFTLIKKEDFYYLIIMPSVVSFIIGLLLGKIL